jgi:hypothetical protein
MVHSKCSRNPLAPTQFEKSYTPQGSVWQSQAALNPLLSPELKIQILVTEVFDQLSDSIAQLDTD